MLQKITTKEALAEIDIFNAEIEKVNKKITLADNSRELAGLVLALDFWTVQKEVMQEIIEENEGNMAKAIL